MMDSSDEMVADDAGQTCGCVFENISKFEVVALSCLLFPAL